MSAPADGSTRAERTCQSQQFGSGAGMSHGPTVKSGDAETSGDSGDGGS